MLLPYASAQESHTVLRIRSVYATEAKGGEDPKTLIPNTLQDIESELSTLPFKKFMLLDSQDVTISLKEKEQIKLSNGDKITIRPLYINSGKLCFWFKWVDKKGLQVLDSKLHVEKGKGIIAGADSSEKEANLISLMLP